METLPLAQLKYTKTGITEVDMLADFAKYTALAGRETA